MRTVKIDVEMEWPEGEMYDALITTADKNAMARAIIERLREKADQEVRAAGGRLVVDTLPEFYVRRGSHVTFGGDFVLAASRWTVEVPDNFDPRRAAAASR